MSDDSNAINNKENKVIPFEHFFDLIKKQDSTLRKIEELNILIKDQNDVYNARLEEIKEIFCKLHIKLPITIICDGRVYQIKDATFQFMISDINYYVYSDKEKEELEEFKKFKYAHQLQRVSSEMEADQ